MSLSEEVTATVPQAVASGEESPANEPKPNSTGCVEKDAENDGSSHDESRLQNLSEPPKKRKKKSKKSKGKRGIDKPTGMEEFYADSPLTPEQFEEQKKLYDKQLPFTDRVLTAIQRFERTRKLTPERRDVFYKWLQYGGIEVGPNIGTGNLDQTQMDKEELTTALSRARISEDISQGFKRTDLAEKSKYIVDFEGCMKGFLSRRAQNIWGFDVKDQVSMVVSTLERFMDFLLQNDVCPEYSTDILKTRNFCREATAELWSCAEALRALPGDFNIACSTLFGGDYSEKYDGKTYWGPESEKPEQVFVGFTPETASQIFGFAIAGVADEHVYQSYAAITQGENKVNLEVVKIFRGQGFEVTQVDKPTAECKDLYFQNSKEYRPVGRVYAKPWTDPEAPPQDLTDEERAALTHAPPDDDAEQYLFFVEEIVSRNLSAGMKIQATVRQLNCGVWFFDEVIRVLPDFEMYLVNDLMIGYIEPKRLAGALDYVPEEESQPFVIENNDAVTCIDTDGKANTEIIAD